MPQPLDPLRPGRSEAREAAALRENLRRRKQQARARAAPVEEPATPCRAGEPQTVRQDIADRSAPRVPVDAEEVDDAGDAR